MMDTRSQTLPWMMAAAVVGVLLVLIAPEVAPFQGPGTPEDGVLLISWWAASLIGAWFLASVILWSIALRSRHSRTTRFASRFGLPGTRKLAESTLALTLMLSPAACTAGVSEAPTLSLVAQGVTTEPASTTVLNSTVLDSTVLDSTLPPTSRPAAVEPVGKRDGTQPSDAVEPSQAEPQTPPPYEVQCGDSLWKIAASHMGDHLGRKPSSAEVAPYWKRLVDLNRASLLSGEADLIYPGEMLVLPISG